MPRNSLAIVLIIYGFTLPGLEIISNALKTYGDGHMDFFSFFLTIVSGLVYTFASLPLISDPNYLKSVRFFKLLPLNAAFITLFVVKFIFINEMLVNLKDFNAWCLFLAEILPGFGKRSILLFALMSPSSSIGQTVDPFGNYEIETPTIKSKKE